MTATSNNRKVRVALYARVSGEEQTIGKNIGAQVDELKGSQPPSHEVVGIYLDDGVSGAVPLADRPEGSRLMADATAGRFDRLMVNRLDRLSRSIVDLNHIAKTLDALGIVLWAQGQEFGQTSMGKFMLNSLGALAEFERDLIKDRTLSGKRFKAKTLGRWPGGTVPYGYAYYKGEPGEEGRWEIIEPEAEVIRRVYAMCVQHDQGVSAIADSLSDEGVLTPSAVRADPKHPRAKPNCRVGKRWERSHISRMLRNPTYIGKPLVAVDGERKDISPGELVHLLRTGEWQPKGLIQLQVPAVVDESLWWAAQDKLDARRRLPNTHYDTWPLQGRITCAADGRRFSCRRNGQQGNRTYSCTGREGHIVKDAPRCKSPRLNADQLEAAVVWYFNGILSSPQTGKKAVESYLSKLEALQEEAARGLGPILERLHELDQQEKRLGDLYVWGHKSREDFEEELAQILKVRQGLEAERRKQQREIDEFETRRAQIKQIRAAIDEERFHVSWSPAAAKLKVTLYDHAETDEDDATLILVPLASKSELPKIQLPDLATTLWNMQPDEIKARIPLAEWKARSRKSLQDLDESKTQFERPIDLRRLFDLFDLKVVVHSDNVEVRGIFPHAFYIGLEEMGEVSLLPSSTGTTRRGRPGGRSLSSPPRRAPALWERSSAARGQWPQRTGRP